MPTFGDFNKDTKDLLTKNYADKGAWKVEGKAKGPEKVLIFNPTAATGKPLSMDVEFNSKPFKTKTNFTETGNIKPKLTWEQKPHKVETTIGYGTKDGKKSLEVNYELSLAKLVTSVKYDHNKSEIDIQDSVNVGSGVSIGSGVVYNLNKPDVANTWSLGVYYAANGLVANWTTKALKSWTAGVNYPVAVSGKKINAAFQIDNNFKWTLGGEGPCFSCPGAKLRLRTNQDFTIGIAWINKVAGNWKAAIGADVKTDGSFSWGTTFTHE